jgi:hypothetical protein
MTVHIDVERVTQRSSRPTDAAPQPFIETQQPLRIRHFALAMAIGLAMWIGIIAVAPSMFHLVVSLIRLF